VTERTFSDLLGVRPIFASSDCASAEVEVDGQHVDWNGRAHLGVIDALVHAVVADVGYMRLNSVCTVHIDYLASARRGDILMALGNVTEVSELGHVLTVRVARYSDERPIALAVVRAAPADTHPAATEPSMN
jgi:acyl-coenzyme A thioesterase PaaI-like protein